MTATKAAENGAPDVGTPNPLLGGLKDLAEVCQVIDQIRGPAAAPAPQVQRSHHQPDAGSFAPDRYPTDDRMRVFDDDGNPETLTSSERRLEKRFNEQVENIHARSRANNIRFAIGYIIFTSLIQVVFNWSYVSWWVDENVLVHVQGVGIAEYQENFEMWSIAKIDRIAAEADKAEIDAKLDAEDFSENTRADLRERSFALRNEVNDIRSWENHYRRILDEYATKYGHDEITENHFRERAKKSATLASK